MLLTRENARATRHRTGSRVAMGAHAKMLYPITYIIIGIAQSSPVRTRDTRHASSLMLIARRRTSEATAYARGGHPIWRGGVRVGRPRPRRTGHRAVGARGSGVLYCTGVRVFALLQRYSTRRLALAVSAGRSGSNGVRQHIVAYPMPFAQLKRLSGCVAWRVTVHSQPRHPLPPEVSCRCSPRRIESCASSHHAQVSAP